MAYLLRCEKLTKDYGAMGSFVRAVNCANIAFPNKGLVAISGKSGCGKSTLLSLLASLEKPSKGRVLYQGQDISSLPPEKLAKYRGQCTGMIFQHYNLFEEDTAIENVELPLLINGYGKKEARKIASKTLNDFMMQGFANRAVSTLSGGEKQRIAICRAMAMSPKILFADEPTGALDEHNSKIVMDALKRLSKSVLVILVSHNAQLIDEYADLIIHMEHGKVLDRPEVDQGKGQSKKMRGHSHSYASHFVKKNLKSNRGNGMLCAFASCVGFLSLCLSLGYFSGSKTVVEDLPMRNLDSSVASIFVEEKIETDSKIALVQQARPDIHAAAAFMGSDFVVDYDLSYFFPKAYGFSLGGEPHDAVSLSPIYDISPDYGFDSLLVKGSGYRSEELDVCLINELLYQKLGADCVGKSLSMEFTNDISSLGLADEVKISARMEIVGVVREFSFLNEPKIYYSYLAAKNVLARYELDNLTREFATEMTALDVIEMASGNSTVSGFALNVFAKRFDRSKELINRIKQNDGDVYSFSSRSYSAVSSFESLTSAFETCLFLFVGVSGAMLIIMLSMSAYAAFVKRKKDASILYCLGGRQSDLMTIFSLESTLHSTAGCLIGLILSPLAAIGIDFLMRSSFDVSGIVRIPFLNFLGVPFLLPIGCILIAALVSLLSTALVLAVAGRFSIVEELRDE